MTVSFSTDRNKITLYDLKIICINLKYSPLVLIKDVLSETCFNFYYPFIVIVIFYFSFISPFNRGRFTFGLNDIDVTLVRPKSY